MRRVIGVLFLLGGIVLALVMLLDPAKLENVTSNAPGPVSEWVSQLPIPGSTPARLLTAARKYDSESYVLTHGHGQAYQPGEGIDCSGLVVRAVKDTTGIYDNRLAADFVNSPHWVKVPVEQAKKGDIVVRIGAPRGLGDDHVAFVVSNGGDGKMSIFEAWSGRVAQPEQIRQTDDQKYDEWDYALRWQG